MEIGIVLLMCGVLAVAFVVYGRGTWQAPKSTQADAQAVRAYETRLSIFVNTAEQVFFKTLLRHMPHGYHVFAKVRLEDILTVRHDIKPAKARWQYRGRIKSRHVDFAVCNAQGRYVCAIELDGNAHHTTEAEMVDNFKNAIFHHAGLPLYRVKVGQDFDAFSRKMWEKIGV